MSNISVFGKIDQLSKELKAEFFEMQNFSPRNLKYIMNFYLSAIDSLVKHESDQPSIGLILCKTKNNVLAQYTLRDMSKPIGLAEYRLTESLPADLKIALPTIEELAAELSKNLDINNTDN